MRTPIPFPLDLMFERYQAGMTCQELSDLLSGEDWQPYWREHLGREYRPSEKYVGQVLRRAGCSMRKSGAAMERNGFWRGGRTLDLEGYVLLKSPGHPYANSGGYVREHRLVMERVLGRYLTPDEVVHHKDENPANNSPENLELYSTNAAHLADTLRGKVPNWTEDGLRRLEETIEAIASRRRGTGAGGQACNGSGGRPKA